MTDANTQARAMASILIHQIANGVVQAQTSAPEPIKPAVILHALMLATIAVVPGLFVREGWATAYRLAAKDLLNAALNAELLDSKPEGGIN